MAVERFQSTLVFPIKCWQKVKFLNSSSSKIKTKQLWAAMQTSPNHDKGFPCTCTWQTESPAQTAGRFSHGTPRGGQGSPSQSPGDSVQCERIERFKADLQSEKCIFRQADLQTLPEVVAFVIYLKKAIRALSFCVVDQYPRLAFLPRTKLQVIKSAPGWFLGGGILQLAWPAKKTAST